MHDEQLRPVLDRLLATRRAKVDDTQGGARKGLRILFAGHSGKKTTGGAAVRARIISRPVQIDSIASSASTWATRKESRRAVHGGRGFGAVLMFDDTDHLFAGESSTGESGRFPSLNVAQLRQRIESYDGVVVLGTDDAAHLDPQFATQCDEVVELADD
jgi:hypothetical protein